MIILDFVNCKMPRTISSILTLKNLIWRRLHVT